MKPSRTLLLTEELIAKYKGSWLDAKDSEAFSGWESSLKETYREAFKLFSAREQLDLNRRLVELYHGTGRMEQDHVFRSLAKDLLPAD